MRLSTRGGGYESLTAEELELVQKLRASHQLLETDDENITVPAGVTHILISKPGQRATLIALFKAK